MLHTTLKLLKANYACIGRYRHLRKALGGARKFGYDTPITFQRLVELNGLNDALWALRAVPEDQRKDRDFITRMFAVGCAERVLPIYEKQYPTDTRVRRCIEVSRLYAHGKATTEELAVAGAAAWDAWAAAWDAWAAAWDAWAAKAAKAAKAAAGAAKAAAWAAWAAEAWAAKAAAWAAGDAAWDAERKWQIGLFLDLLDPKHPIHQGRSEVEVIED